MTDSAHQVTRPPAALKVFYAPVREELDQVEQILRQQLTSVYPLIDQLARHSFRLGGKRLRPALVLLSAKSVESNSPQAVGEAVSGQRELAAMVELIHTATLIHDDVLDDAKLRRHMDTVNAQWDNETSVLLGDYLFAQALCLGASLKDLFVTQAVSDAVRSICEGELRQIASRGQFDLTEDDYLSIIGSKTGALTACCCRLGAHCARADCADVEALVRYGELLGVAFQIADDILDLTGDESRTGKSLGTDLAKQKPTLPLIRLLEQVGSEQRAEILGLLSPSDNHHREALRPWLARYDALDYARQKALDFARQAVEQIAHLPESPARESLAGLAEFCVTRQS